MNGLWWVSHLGIAFTNPHQAEEPSQPIHGPWTHSPQHPGCAPFLMVIAGMYNAESQQGIVKPLPSRQTTSCHACWMADFKAYDLLQITYMSWKEHKLSLISTLRLQTLPDNLPYFSCQDTSYSRSHTWRKTPGTRKQLIWKLWFICG